MGAGEEKIIPMVKFYSALTSDTHSHTHNLHYGLNEVGVVHAFTLKCAPWG